MCPVVIHRAPWVVPVSTHVIDNGAVATDGKRILEAAPFPLLRKTYPYATVHEHDLCALTPALINAHIHIELSHIPIPEIINKVDSFTDWIEALLTIREEKGSLGTDVEDAARQTLLSQHRQGVAVLGDIGNTTIGSKLRGTFPGSIIHFNECLGRTAKTRRAVLDRVIQAPSEELYTAHAPYSTHPKLICELKNRARERAQLFSIHVAEPPSENELLCCGTGELHSFLKRRGFIDDTYQPPAGIDNTGSVQYLHTLGVLDKKTICVHCIHVTPEEVQLLAETQTKVCLCPGSNRYLRVGTAPVEMYLQSGILPALGTDSLASNPELSIWREMKILYEEHPTVDPADIFRMATLGGAAALAIDDEYGTLEAGKSSKFLAVPIDKDVTSETTLYEYLVQHELHQPEWVSSP